MNAVIIDDEPNSITSLQWLIQNYAPEITVISSFTSPSEAIPFLKRSKIDVLFLDIEMKEMNGFEMIKKLDDINFLIVFVTAYDNYAINAFKINAIDYLLKPVDKDDFIATVEKIKNKAGVNNKVIFDIISNLQRKETRKIALSTLEGLDLYDANDLMYCESDVNYTRIFFTDGTSILMSKTLKLIEETLPSDIFVRVHNSVIVNINHIKKVYREDGGYLMLKNGKTISISKSRKADLMNKFSKI